MSVKEHEVRLRKRIEVLRVRTVLYKEKTWSRPEPYATIYWPRDVECAIKSIGELMLVSLENETGSTENLCRPLKVLRFTICIGISYFPSHYVIHDSGSREPGYSVYLEKVENFHRIGQNYLFQWHQNRYPNPWCETQKRENIDHIVMARGINLCSCSA